MAPEVAALINAGPGVLIAIATVLITQIYSRVKERDRQDAELGQLIERQQHEEAMRSRKIAATEDKEKQAVRWAAYSRLVKACSNYRRHLNSLTTNLALELDGALWEAMSVAPDLNVRSEVSHLVDNARRQGLHQDDWERYIWQFLNEVLKGDGADPTPPLPAEE